MNLKIRIPGIEISSQRGMFMIIRLQTLRKNKIRPEVLTQRSDIQFPGFQKLFNGNVFTFSKYTICDDSLLEIGIFQTSLFSGLEVTENELSVF